MKKIALFAGGTGGHIFPAIALGNWLKEQQKTNTLYFVCGSRDIETEIYNSQGIKPIILDIEGSPSGVKAPGKIAVRTWHIIKESLNVFMLLRKTEPDCCILFGGYISILPLFIATALKIPVIVHEQNTVAGKLTRLAFKLKKKILTGWDECEPLVKGSFIPAGVPVRNFSVLQDSVAWNILHIGLPFSDSPTIVVIGGSLGSENLIRVVLKTAGKETFMKCNFIILGDNKDSDCPENVFFAGKHWDMAPLYSLADVAIARAGASCLAELSAYNIPAVIVPWSESSEGHQLNNAKQFLKAAEGKTWLETSESMSNFEDKLEELVNKTVKNGNTRAARELHGNSACETIWKNIVALGRRENL